MKVVNYSINTFYVLKMAICLRSLKLFLKKWEFKHLGSFPGLVPFQGDYGYGSSRYIYIMRRRTDQCEVKCDLLLSLDPWVP